MKNVCIGYWNCRSSRKRGRELEKLAYDFDLFFLQETNAKTLSCPGYTSYINPVSPTHHGLATLVRNDIQHRVRDVSAWDREDRELQALEITIRNRSWVIVNLYAGGGKLVKEDDWEFLHELCGLGDVVMIVGDFNARSSAWGNVNENGQGKALDSKLIESDLHILNISTMTRLSQRTGEQDSNIDLALIKTGGEAFTQWSVLADHGSDHLPCSVLISKGGKTVKQKVKRVFKYKPNTSVLGGLRKKAWNRRPSRPNITQPPWWSNEIDCLWKEKRKAVKDWQRNRKKPNATEEEREAAKEKMRQARDKFKAEADLAKKTKWEEFVKNVAAEKALSQFWKLRKKMCGQGHSKTTVNVKDESGKTLLTDEEKGRAFLDRFVHQTHQGNIDSRKEVERDVSSVLTPEVYANYEDEISREEVSRTIKRAKDSAGGPDGVRYCHMKEADDEMIEEMTKDFNMSISTGKIPEEWLHSWLIPIPKPGKDHSALSGYRIIAMQNTYGKILEKIVAGRISAHLEKKSLLPNELGSYRPHRETAVNVAVMAYDIYEGFQQRKETVVTALDLEDAYNRVDYERLIDLLLKFDVDIWLVRWVAVALLERKMALRQGAWTSDPISISPGLPQGSPLSPVLFNVYTAQVTMHQKESGRVLSFADDIMAYEHGDDRLQMARNMEKRLHSVVKWCDQNEAIINPSKAQVLWCSLDNRIVQDITPPITCNYEVIDRQSELKYLGIVFDRSLSFNKHVDHVVMRAKRGVGAIKTMAAALIPQRVLFLMLQLVVLSVIDYGLGCLTLSDTQIAKLDRVQNEAMRAVLGCTKDTPILCMRYLLGLSGIRVRHRIAQTKMYLSVMGKKDHPLHKALHDNKGGRIKRGRSWMAEAEDSLRKICVLENLPLGEEWEQVAGEYRDLTKVKISMGRDRRNVAASINESDINEIVDKNSKAGDPVIYTDGSVKRDSQRSGWGFVAFANNKIIHSASGACTRATSSMRMEIEAITKALEWMTQDRPHTTHAVLITDSMCTLRKIEQGFLRAEWIQLIEATPLRSLAWIFCPGHAGVKGNEKADRLAGEATSVDSTVKPDKVEVLKRLSRHLIGEEDKEAEASPAVERMMVLGVQKGSGKSGTLAGKNRRTFNQICTGTISRKTLGNILERATEHQWTCPECRDVAS